MRAMRCIDIVVRDYGCAGARKLQKLLQDGAGKSWLVRSIFKNEVRGFRRLPRACVFADRFNVGEQRRIYSRKVRCRVDRIDLTRTITLTCERQVRGGAAEGGSNIKDHLGPKSADKRVENFAFAFPD